MNASKNDYRPSSNNASYCMPHSRNVKDDNNLELIPKEEDPLENFLEDTDEINDIVIINEKGEVHYLFSRDETLDEEYLESFKEDFQ
jgi:hypothetical protein